MKDTLARLESLVQTVPGRLLTLGEHMKDYVVHLEHHLAQIFGEIS